MNPIVTRSFNHMRWANNQLFTQLSEIFATYDPQQDLHAR